MRPQGLSLSVIILGLGSANEGMCYYILLSLAKPIPREILCLCTELFQETLYIIMGFISFVYNAVAKVAEI